MSQFGTLGIFLVLAYIVPGVTIFAALLVLVPPVGAFFHGRTAYELLAATLLICFFNGHVGFLIETISVQFIWKLLYRDLRSPALLSLFNDRSNLLVEAEFYKIPHTHIDQIFGEFILYTNSSIALLGIALFRILDHLTLHFTHSENLSFDAVYHNHILVILHSFSGFRREYDIISDIIILVLSSTVLFFTAPIYKLRLIKMLDTLRHLLIERRDALERLAVAKATKEIESEDDENIEDEDNGDVT